MNNKSIQSINISRKFSFFMFIFILIVVLFHSDFRYFYPFIEDLTAVSTSYFFMVSAFFFYRNLEHKDIPARLKKRCVTLILPYLLWNIIYMIFQRGNYDYSMKSIVEGFTVDPICTPSWYLLTLFIFFLPAPLIKRAYGKVGSTIVLILVGVAISYLGYIKFQAELFGVPFAGGYLIRMSEYITPYLIGGMLGTWFQGKISVDWKKCPVGVIASVVIVVLLFNNIPVTMRWLLWVLLPIALWEAVPEKIFKYTRFLQVVTEPSFVINMMHCYFLYFWETILMKMTTVTGKRFSLSVLVCAIVSSCIVYYLLKIFAPKVLKVLIGNRGERK